MDGHEACSTDIHREVCLQQPIAARRVDPDEVHQGPVAVRDIVHAALNDTRVTGQDREHMQSLLLLVAVEYSDAARELLAVF